MKNPRVIAIVVGVLVLLAVGLLFFRGPQPHIAIRAEKLTDIGPFPLVNTYVTSVFVVVTVITLAFISTRNITLIPGKLQNAIEAIVETLYTICINTAGEANARRFFPVIMTIFTFIWIANWMALLPFFNSIGSVQRVDAHHFYHTAVVFDDAGGVFSFIRPNTSEIEFHPDEARVVEINKLISDARGHGADAGVIAGLQHERDEVYNEAIVEGLHHKGLIGEDVHDIETAFAQLDAEGKTLGVLYPWFRSMNTDINSPLSIAIMAMIFIEFWGITALGFFKYAGKFINFSSPIYFFVGILELIAEFARIVSFTFRLFGNMLAGEILLLVMTFLVPFLIAIPFYGLEVFVGLIQAFVFAMLTLVFAVLATSAHEGHDEHDEIHEAQAQTPDLPLEGPVPATH